MIHIDPHAVRCRRLAAVLLAAAVSVTVFGGCSPTGGDENDFSLEDAAAQIAAAFQQANECRDLTLVLTAEQFATALQEQFEASDGSLAFEVFVQEQVDLFDELANTACGISSDGNENADDNPNGNDNQNDNG